MRYLLCFFLLNLTISNLNATTYEWNGGRGSWSNQNNWTPVGVPGYRDNAIIHNGTVQITVGQVEASHIDITNQGILVVGSTSILESAGTRDRSFIVNHGLIYIDGLVIIDRVGGSSTNSHGIDNHGSIELGSSGFLFCSDIPGYGIKSYDHGFFKNEGDIEMNECGGGINNYGVFHNYGGINITENVMFNGIANRGSFINRIGSNIVMSDFGIGIVNYAEDNAVFRNYSNISMLDMSTCISVGGYFYNYVGGTLALSESSVGLSVGAEGTFYNYSSIIAEHNSIAGIVVSKSLINYGYITASYNGGDGIRVFKIWQFVYPELINGGDIQSLSNANASIVLSEANLRNLDDGIFYTDGNLEGDAMINHGIFSVSGSGPHSIELENYGVVRDIHNSLEAIIDNHSVVLRPIPGPLVYGVQINNALEVDSRSFVDVGNWWDQMANGHIIGAYSYPSNIFIPNWHGHGLNEVFVWVNIKSSGLNKRLSMNIGTFGGSLQKADGEYAKDLQESISKKYTCYPNPSNGNFTIVGFERGHVLIKDMDGKTVWEQDATSGDFRLEGILDNGSYQVVLSSEGAEPAFLPIIVQK